MNEQKSGFDPFQKETVISPKEARLRRAAKIVGFIAAGVGLPLTLFGCMSSFQSDWNPGLVYASISCILRFFVLWLALHYPLVGGILLITDGFILACLSLAYIYAGSIPAVLCLLLIPSGILFILTWSEHRKNVPVSH